MHTDIASVRAHSGPARTVPRLLRIATVVAVAIGSIATGVPRAGAAAGSPFCVEAQTEIAKLSAIAKKIPTGAKSTPAILKAQLAPLQKAYNDSSAKLQRDAPAALRPAVKAYLDQGEKALIALEKAGWDVKKLPLRVPDPANFKAVIAPLVAYAKTTCGVVLEPLAGLSTTP